MEYVSRSDLCNVILSMVVCGIYFAEPDTILVFTIFYKLFGGRNPPCNAEDNMRAGLVVIEAWFRGY